MCPDIPVFSLTQTQAPSVIVWVDESGVAHARNMKTGSIIAESADHASVLQAAINAVAQTGGKVLVKNGTYVLTTSVNPKSKVILESEYAVLTQPSGANIDLIYAPPGSKLEKFVLRGFILDGNGSNQTGGFAVVNLNADEISDILIEDCEVRNAYAHGIRITEASTHSYRPKVVRNCSIHHFALKAIGYGVYFDYAPYATVEGCRFWGSPNVDNIELGHLGHYFALHNYLEGGINFPFADNSVIAYNRIIYSGPEGIQNDVNTANDVVIAYNVVEGVQPPAGYGGIAVFGNRAKVVGNRVKVANAQPAIFIRSGDNALVAHNYVETADGGIGIYLDQSNNSIIAFNTIGTVGANGKGISVVLDGNIIIGNMVLQAGVGVHFVPYSTSGHVIAKTLVAYNDLSGASTPVQLQPTNHPSNWIFGNRGFSPQPVSSVNVPANATTTIGPFNYPVQVILSAPQNATSVSLTRGGTVFNLPIQSSYLLHPEDTLVVTEGATAQTAYIVPL